MAYKCISVALYPQNGAKQSEGKQVVLNKNE